jgi:hypothetical protein
MKVVQVILGIVLLLPGICSAGAMILLLPMSGADLGTLMPLWLISFAIAAFGIWLIRNARNRQ